MKKILCLLVPVCLFSCVSKSDYTELETKYEKLKSDYTELEKEYEELESYNNDLNRQFDGVLKDNMFLKEKINKLSVYPWDR